jgi:four helix bundle protein
MTNDQTSNLAPAGRKTFDLEERTAQFGEKVIGFAKTLSRDPVTLPLISQLVRAATSIGANYLEADDAESKKDFRHKIGICRKESRECKHWLRMVSAAQPEHRDAARALWQEAKELNLIFGAIRKRQEAQEKK